MNYTNLRKGRENMSNTIFENIKNIDENGNEYWSARDLQEVLQYKEFRNFETAIKKAITACENSDINVSNHFVDANKMINLAKGDRKSTRLNSSH